MCVVGATTATRDTRPSASIRWAMCSPKVVLPAAGVADARNASPEWSKTAAAAVCCQARRGLVVGQEGRERPTAGASIWNVTGGGTLGAGPDETSEPKGARPLYLRYVRWTRGVPVSDRGPDRTYRPDMRPPTLHGLHQPGIATPQLRYAQLTAYEG